MTKTLETFVSTGTNVFQQIADYWSSDFFLTYNTNSKLMVFVVQNVLPFLIEYASGELHSYPPKQFLFNSFCCTFNKSTFKLYLHHLIVDSCCPKFYLTYAF